MYHDLPSHRQILVVPFRDRPRSCRDHPQDRRVPAADACTAPTTPASRGAAPTRSPRPTSLRLSFCCDRDGCRKRATPPSVRFLGRKVYLAVVVILVSAMRHGPTPRRVRELSARFGVDRRTIARWQVFWREHFPQTPLLEGRTRPSGCRLSRSSALPYSLLDAFLRAPIDRRTGWARLLRFLAPITIPGGPAESSVSLMIALDPQKMLLRHSARPACRRMSRSLHLTSSEEM